MLYEVITCAKWKGVRLSDLLSLAGLKKDAGGIDIFLGGVGADGHIAFNEPGSSLHRNNFV